MRNGPCTVCTVRSVMRLISDSFWPRKRIRSAIEAILMPWRAENSTRSGSRAMVPSSFRISQITAAGVRPASVARSQPASVWPARTSTPPPCAISGKMCPGWTMSSGFAFGATAACTVRARSCAEMPVVTPLAASIETVNAVPSGERLSRTISGRFSCRQRCSVSVRQISPRPCFDMKLIASGVTNSAAMTRSPSFSRCSSSTRITIRPDFSSAMISGIELRLMAQEKFYATGEARAGLLLAAALLLVRRDLLADARALARAAAHVIQLGAAHVALALHLDRGDERRVGLERALDALARGDLAHGERRVEAAVALALDDAHADDDGVARVELGHVLAEALDLVLLDLLDQIHGFAPFVSRS